MLMIYVLDLDHMLEVYYGCMVLTLGCGLRNFRLRCSVGYVEYFLSDVMELCL
jgi:hypothetical protein